MKKIKTRLPDVYIIEPQIFGDLRGYFMETYSTAAFADIGIDAYSCRTICPLRHKRGRYAASTFRTPPWRRQSWYGLRAV